MTFILYDAPGYYIQRGEPWNPARTFRAIGAGSVRVVNRVPTSSSDAADMPGVTRVGVVGRFATRRAGR
jgi:hypothetical protein